MGGIPTREFSASVKGPAHRVSENSTVALSASMRVAPLAHEIVDAAVGYRLVANAYDDWHWQRFWAQNETPLVVEHLKTLTSGRALDVGTGTGRYVRVLRELRHEGHGIDISPQMLAQAATQLGSEQGLAVADVRSLPFQNLSFDAITCCRVLSHIRALASAFEQFHRVLRKGGRLVITDIDSRHNYKATRIPIRDGNVFIRVHKHSAGDLMCAARAHDFRVVSQRSITAKELPERLDRRAFPAIDWSGQRPLLSILVLERK